MHDDRLESYKLQQNRVLYHMHLQFIIYHGTAAIFDYYYFAIEPLYVWESLDKNVGLLHVFLFYHLIPLL